MRYATNFREFENILNTDITVSTVRGCPIHLFLWSDTIHTVISTGSSFLIRLLRPAVFRELPQVVLRRCESVVSRLPRLGSWKLR